jgi:large subunit ribosomal protein L13
MKTPFPSRNDVVDTWRLLDAKDQVLGRLATKAARYLMGKHKPNYTPFLDMGDHVVIINADKVRLTGRKEEQKIYRYHSGYPGGLKEISSAKLRAVRPVRLVEEAIAGMLPKTKLGKKMYRKLRVYAGDKHPHAAQKPHPDNGESPQ